MRNGKVLIYEWRYLVAKGIEQVLKENFPDLSLYLVLSEEEFVYTLRTYKIDLLIINGLKLIKFRPLIQSGARKLKIVSIGKERIRDLDIAFYINLASSERFIVENFRLVLGEKKEDVALTDRNELTEREKEVLRLIAMGYTSQQIAERLVISPHTVVTHRKNITRKLGIKSISGLTIYAIINGIVRKEDVKWIK